MKLTFPKIVHVVDMGEYDEAMKGQVVSVWVNPPSGHLVKLGKLNHALMEKPTDETRLEYLDLLSELLSQGDNKFSTADLDALMTATQDTDPRFWIWFQVRVIEEINEHRLGLKKGSKPQAPS